MDDGELVATLVAIGLAGVFLGRWGYSGATVFAPETPPILRWSMLIIVGALLVGFFIALGFIADADVSASFGYRILFAATAALSVRFMFVMAETLGFDPIACGLQQNNTGAVIASVGGAAAMVVINVGANIGTGETIGTTLLPVLLGSIAIALYTVVLAWTSRLPQRISGNRSESAGWRLAGWIVAASLPLARGASADWVSVGDTLRDMITAGGPLLILLAFAFVVERIWPSFRTGRVECVPITGVAPAIAAVALGATLTWPLLLRW